MFEIGGEDELLSLHKGSFRELGHDAVNRMLELTQNN